MEQAGSGPRELGPEPSRLDRPSTSLMRAPALEEILYGGRILENGSRGYAVKVVQTALARTGVGLRGGADGHFGPATRLRLMDFQRESGMVPTGILDRETLLALDHRLQELDKGHRTEALPAPRPLRGFAAAYLENDAERCVFEETKGGLVQIRDWATTTAPDAVREDLLAVIERLEGLAPESYRNVLRALASEREASAWAPTLLDLLLALPATISEAPELRESLCGQLVRKLPASRSGVGSVLNHASPDSVSRLKGAPSFPALLQLLG